MIYLSKQQKDRLGWSGMIGTGVAAIISSVVLNAYLQSNTPVLEAVGGGLMIFLIVGLLVAGGLYVAFWLLGWLLR